MTIDLCYLVSGLQAQTQSSDESGTLPRRRITGDSQYQSDLDDGPSPDTPIRSPIRCISPEFANAIAMNPGGRPKEVGRKKKKKNRWSPDRTHSSAQVNVFVGLVVSACRETCTATGRRLRKWTEALIVRHPQLVVRCSPKPLPSPFCHKPLTSTCVSSTLADRGHCGVQLCLGVDTVIF